MMRTGSSREAHGVRTCRQAAGRISLLGSLIVALMVRPAPCSGQVIDEDRLTIHGFVTQAWARAWTNPVAGIPVGGSTLDYRSVALQAGYSLVDSDRIVIQMSHRRIGDSLLEGKENEVRIDWAFYDRHFGEGSVRMGRVPLPRGLANEIRYVGTALPFYRAPLHYYLESAETLDGAIVGYRFLANRPWSVQAEVYGGQWDANIVINRPTGPILRPIDARSVLGTQVWLETPIAGIRLGIGGNRYDETSVRTGGKLQGSSLWQLSGESHYGRFDARAEFEHAHSEEYSFVAKYLQLGFSVLPVLAVNIQTEDSHIDAPTLSESRVEQAHDHAVGLAWSVAPWAVLKIEGHWLKGFGVDTWYSYDDPLPRAQYAIASLAVAF